MRVIDGMKLVPHFNEYFLDTLHPNCLGCEVYGRNLAVLLLSGMIAEETKKYSGTHIDDTDGSQPPVIKNARKGVL